MTLLVSQQIYCGEDKNKNAKKPIGAQSIKPSDSYLSWKNAKIAGALVGGAAIVGGAYYYQDVLLSLINGNSDPAVVRDQVKESIEVQNAEVTQDLHAIAEKENNVAKLEEFQALSADAQAQIVAQLTADAAKVAAVEATPILDAVADMPVKTPSAPAVNNQVPEAPQAIPMYDWENKPGYSAVAYGLNSAAAAGNAINSAIGSTADALIPDALVNGMESAGQTLVNSWNAPNNYKAEPTEEELDREHFKNH